MKVLKLPTIREQLILQALSHQMMAKHIYEIIRKSDVAINLQITTVPSVTLVLTKLAENGYVTRQRGPNLHTGGFFYLYERTERANKLLPFIQQEGVQA